ncbi:MAG TPA: HEAT repeat domain-containing protein, partial [Longimicrobiaceae bacterium]|nr:HEAT repeat domain-containing protein [Longimicrobiaceae bacterium]
RADVKEVVGGFGKALRTHLLYEGGGPALERFIDSLRGKMAALWDRVDHLRLGIEQHDLVWEGASVFHAEERGEDLAFLLYKDGLRELLFFPGFEEEELSYFLTLLARIQRLRSDEEDLLTLLWDHDWLHFQYRYVEPLSEGVEVPIASAVPVRPAPPVEREEPEVLTSVSREDFQEALYFLDEGELRALAAELKRETERQLWLDVLNALFDRLEDGLPDRQEQIVAVLSDILPTLLGAGNLETAAYVMRELVGIATGGRLAAPVLRALRSLFEQLAHPQTVAELIRIVEEGGATVSEEALRQLFQFFPPEALGPLLHAGEVAESPTLRGVVQSAAERLGSANQDHLVRLVASDDDAVAAGAARLAGRLRIAAAAGEVARLMQRESAPLRVTAAEALQELRTPTASAALEAALDDGDKEVRVAAARGLGAIRFSPARARLEAALDSKRLREAELTERITFFEAYGALAGEAGVAVLDRMLNGKNWLGRRESAEIRACAALGLGKARLPSAERALTAAAADPEPVVRSAVGRALRALKS